MSNSPKHGNQDLPLVTIIMAVYNAEDTLDVAIRSIINQSYKNIELIIIDGQSTDASIKIIQRYLSQISYFISEKDRGIYDAWNKAINSSKGSWICFLGADDQFKENAIEEYVTYIIQDPDSRNLDYISSMVALTNSSGTIREIVGSAWNWQKYKRYMNVAHVGSFHSKKLFAEVGLYDLSYKIIADYELLLRKGPNLKAGFINKVTATMIVGGASDSKRVLKELENLRIKTLDYNPLYAYLLYLLANISLFIRKFCSSLGLHIRLKK